MSLTDPPSPLIIGGDEYPNWRPAGTPGRRSAILALTVNGDSATVFLSQLGQYVPGLLEDGTTVEFYINTVQRVSSDTAEVTVIPSVSQAWGDLL